MASILSALLRRDASRARRAGIGRQTTKRTFVLSLPAARGAPRNTRNSRGSTGKRNSKGMEDVSNYWPSAPDAENIGMQAQQAAGGEAVQGDKYAAALQHNADGTVGRASVGLSPIFAGEEPAAVEQPSAGKERQSMGTSPIVPSPAKSSPAPEQPSPSSSDDSGPPSPQPTPHSSVHSSPEPSPQPSEQPSPEPSPQPSERASPEPSPEPSP